MKRSRRDLSINMVIDRFILKNNQITYLFTKLFICFTFIPKTGIGLSKTGIIFSVYAFSFLRKMGLLITKRS